MLPVNLDTLTHYRDYSSFAFDVPMLSREEERELLEIRDEDAVRRIIIAFLRVPISIVHREFNWSSIPREDLIQEGVIGLIKAVRDFDIEFDTSFYSFAHYRVRDCIKEYTLNYEGLIKFATSKPRRNVQLGYNRRKDKTTDHLSLDEAGAIAADLGVPTHEVIEYTQHRAITYHPIGVPIGGEESPYPEDILVYEESEPMQNVFELIAEPYRKILTEKERDIIYRRWIVDPEFQVTLSGLAREYGVSHEQIRQIEKRAFAKIKEWVIENDV